MSRTACAFGFALLGALLAFAFGYEHDETSIRAPWTGLTLGAAAAAFVLAGVFGRGWRALAASAVVATAAMALEYPPWRDEPLPPVSENACDPGCGGSIDILAAVPVAEAVVLTAAGMALRRLARLRH